MYRIDRLSEEAVHNAYNAYVLRMVMNYNRTVDECLTMEQFFEAALKGEEYFNEDGTHYSVRYI